MKGEQLPLAWAHFRTAILARCKPAGTKAELHQTTRPASCAICCCSCGPRQCPDDPARTARRSRTPEPARGSTTSTCSCDPVAKSARPDIGKFRRAVEGFRQIKEKIEQVANRIDAAETVEAQYRKVASQATRAASYRALGAEYRADAHGERSIRPRKRLPPRRRETAYIARAGTGAQRSLDAPSREEAQRRLQGTPRLQRAGVFRPDRRPGPRRTGAAEARADGARLRPRPARRGIEARSAGLDIDALTWRWRRGGALFQQVSTLPADATSTYAGGLAHPVAAAMAQAADMTLVSARNHELRSELGAARQRAKSARQNQNRCTPAAELRSDVIRLMTISRRRHPCCRPVCDLVQVTERRGRVRSKLSAQPVEAC